MIRLVILLLVLSTSAAQAWAQAIYAENQIPAQGVQIEYEVSLRNPVSHLYDVQMNVRGIRGDFVDVAMPAWAPGAYRIADYARNVQDFSAATPRGLVLGFEKTDKQTWRIVKQPADDVQIRYQVFSTRLSDEMADLAGPATFMYVVGQKHVPIRVRYDPPRGWDVYTGLDRRGNWYHASDYDIFIDAPAFVGRFKVLEFVSAGVPHRLVFSKRDISMFDQQVIADVQDIVDAAISIFGSAPYPHYTFLIKVQSQSGSGGLEHLNSSRITVGENDLVNQAGYQRFLFVVAHEFFHVWNGKRIRPEVLGPFDYTKEVHTRLLWAIEGLTDYYANLLLLRTGILTPPEYYGFTGSTINTLQHRPGRLLMSLEEASWDAWLTSDNGMNSTISYYEKGEIVGLLLDLEIRGRTDRQKSLDDVMRYLVQNYADEGHGIPEDGFLRALEAVTASDFSEFYRTNIQSREELDYNRYLHHAGLEVEVSKLPASIHVGIEFEQADGNLPRIRRVLPNSPAESAALDAGDILIAMSDERLTFDNFRSRLLSHRIGERIKLTVVRGERLLTIEIVPIEFEEERWGLYEAVNPTPEQLELRGSWLAMLQER